ncbi:MAG: NusG domain II-containing protein [Candidatus Aminicenantales bacterium]
MDRRDFLRFLFASPLAVPLLSMARVAEDSPALYLITDNPQNYLPTIVTEMEKSGLIQGTRFSLREPHPFAGELRAALARKGWEYASGAPSAALTLAFQPLRRSAPPSFTLIRHGRVWDLRTRELGKLWREMNARSSASTCLTVASFSKPAPLLSPGRSAAVFVDGKKRDTLSLKISQMRRYRTLRGEVLIRVEGGKVEVLASSCRHKICQSSAPAFLTGERIVCAPNHFLLAIDGPRFIDTVTG